MHEKLTSMQVHNHPPAQQLGNDYQRRIADQRKFAKGEVEMYQALSLGEQEISPLRISSNNLEKPLQISFGVVSPSQFKVKILIVVVEVNDEPGN